MNKTSYVFKDDGTYPNNILPLVFLKQAIQSTGPISPFTIENVFHENKWVNCWRNGLFAFHHYHSTAHEALGIYCGWVTAQLGGPDGKIVTIEAGDVVVIPAGVAHKNIDQSPDFRVVGAYPTGQVPDMKYGKPGERPTADQNIQSIDLPEYDPVYGKTGPLMELWS
nr:hypothetical protein [uncultured Desulfobacter sp.]